MNVTFWDGLEAVFFLLKLYFVVILIICPSHKPMILCLWLSKSHKFPHTIFPKHYTTKTYFLMGNRLRAFSAVISLIMKE